LLFVLIPAMDLAAQRGGSQMQLGNHAIEIHMVNQEGAPLSISVRVEVLTDSGMKMAEAYSNREQGVADFEGFNDGYFQLRVSGPDVETVTQTFQIVATEATHREYIRVDLKNSNPATSVSPGSDPTVSAEDLSIPAKAREEFGKGMEAYARGDDKEAQTDLERALEVHPRYVKAHNNLGVLYLKAGLKEKASVEFNKAIEYDAKFAPGYVNLARVFISNEDFATAEIELKKALQLQPSAVNAMVLLCSTQFARKEFDESLRTARHVHQLTQEAGSADIHLVAGEILLNAGKSHEAVVEYRAFVAESPTDPRVPKVKSMIERLAK
jgi:Tfp pilus assembly protein PilF